MYFVSLQRTGSKDREQKNNKINIEIFYGTKKAINCCDLLKILLQGNYQKFPQFLSLIFTWQNLKKISFQFFWSKFASDFPRDVSIYRSVIPVIPFQRMIHLAPSLRISSSPFFYFYKKKTSFAISLSPLSPSYAQIAETFFSNFLKKISIRYSVHEQWLWKKKDEKRIWVHTNQIEIKKQKRNERNERKMRRKKKEKSIHNVILLIGYYVRIITHVFADVRKEIWDIWSIDCLTNHDWFYDI